jgi:outer membrane protein assembly factor BamB
MSTPRKTLINFGKEPAVPVDLDEMFTAMGRSADALPLPGSDAARQLGQRRNRNRNALVAAAAAVLLVIAGVGAVTRRHDRSPEPILPATTVRGLTPVGSPLQIYGPANRSMFSRIAILGDRVYVSSGSLDGGEMKVIGVDGTTGAKLWDAGELDSFETNGTIAVPGALILADGPDLRIRDPETGEARWTAKAAGNGDIVVGDGVLVRVGEDYLTQAFDLVTGAKLWSVPATGTARPRHTVGFGDQENTRNIHVSDGRLAQITLGGTVLIRDIRTGKVLRSVPTTVRPKMLTEFSAAGDEVFITDSTGYMDQPSRLLAVDVTTGGTRTLWSDNSGHLRTHEMCGPHLLCLASSDELDALETVKAIDTTTGKALWTAAPPVGVARFLTRAGRVFVVSLDGTMTLYGNTGKVIATVENDFANADADWIDDRNLLIRTPGTDGFTLSVISADDGKRTTLTELSRSAGGCESTSELLACQDGVHLKLWRFVS